jgi:hypothetical protein
LRASVADDAARLATLRRCERQGVIGGAGTGKITVLELILLALDVPLVPSRAAAHDAMGSDALGSGTVGVGIHTKYAPARTARCGAWSTPTASS